MKKKKVIIHSDFSLMKSGFGRNAKTILSYLYKTGKYDLVNYCCGHFYGSQELEKTPWKSIGCLPNNPKEIEILNRDPKTARDASYGKHYLDKIIRDEKPDVYIGIQDFWGIDYAIETPWFDKINSVIWTTLDSLPLHPAAVDSAPKIKNYWVWSSFAEKELHRLGHTHVKTVHGGLDDSFFYRLGDKSRFTLREKNKIEKDAFVIGFVFRNQLRKSVPNLLEGYKLWKTRHPEVKKSYLLLHTHFAETWDIPKLAKEYGVDNGDILASYICKYCKEYEIKAFEGQNKRCKCCGGQDGQITVNTAVGVSEEQLNEIYNLMDVYCHPFTSGGQEIPVQEAKLTELITLVTNYSCGEELCEEGAYSIPLEWHEWRDHGTNFRKASTSPQSIAKQIQKVYSMDAKTRSEWGKKARQYALEQYSINNVGKIIEEFLDNCPEIKYDFDIKSDLKNPDAKIPNIEDNGEWILTLYREILRFENINDKDEGYKYWLEQIKNGTKRENIEHYFRQIATQENAKNQEIKFEELLDKDDSGKRIVYVMPESIGDVYLSTSLFPNIKKAYPDYNLYVATKPINFEILEGNPYVHKVIPYVPQMDDLLWLEGIGNHKGYFEIAFLPHIGTQKILDYLHNGKFKMNLDIKE